MTLTCSNVEALPWCTTFQTNKCSIPNGRLYCVRSSGSQSHLFTGACALHALR